MNKKKRVLFISVIFLVSAVIYQTVLLTILRGWNDIFQILSIVPLILGTTGSIISIFIPSSYVCFISPDDWQNEKNEWHYSIPKKCHRCGKNPTVATYIKESDGTYAEAILDIGTNNKGDIILGAGSQLTCEIKAIITG